MQHHPSDLTMPSHERPPSLVLLDPDSHISSDVLDGGMLTPTPNLSDMHDTCETLVYRGDEEKLHSFLDISVDSEQLCLKGAGDNAEPTFLSGHIILQLVEATSIKEIILHFRGKAKMPIVNVDAQNNAPHHTYPLCYHDWSFLKGTKNHSHTLKAGRHMFPFHLRVGDLVPSSLSTTALGEASIHYKLRAVASRPGLSRDFHAEKPIVIFRSFAPTALEYQQSLDIENTWPGKLMYSIIVPHKAWAAGDTLTALVKFSPISKGSKVISVCSSITETIKLYLRSGTQETTRILITTKHAIIDGKAVCTDVLRDRHILPPSNLHRSSLPPMSQPTLQSQLMPNTYSPSRPSTRGEELSPVAISDNGRADEAGASSVPEEGQTHSPDDTDTNEDVVATIQITLPETATPSHNHEPIVVSHRIKWSIFIANRDGHSSELRCSLPLHILDHLVLRESRALTAQTRRLLLGDLEGLPEQDAETQLPSYSSHIRDLIPEFDYPSPDREPSSVSTDVTPPSGSHSPVAAPPSGGHLPHVPSASVSSNRSLAWINSQLLRQQDASCSGVHPRASPPESRHGGRSLSRVSTRPPSPESGARNADSILTSGSVNATHPTHSQRGGALHNLFHMSLKPFPSFSSSFSLSPRATSHPLTPPGNPTNQAHAYPESQASSANGCHRTLSGSASPASTSTPVSPTTSRFLTEVPDYEVASRGFAGGGVTPLSSIRDLPSYEEASHHDAGATPRSEVELTTGLSRTVIQDV